jgi:alpha-tubulin suppressor-like RCC1 family protein
MSYPPISTGGQQALATNSNRLMRNGNSPADANMLGASLCRRFMDVIIDQVAGPMTGTIIQVLNNEFNCAFVTSTGQVWVGGNNAQRQLGIPASTDTQYFHRRFKQVTGMPPIVAIFTHRDTQTTITYACVSATGTVYTWGYNGHGAVGDGTVAIRTSPFLVPLPGGATVEIMPGGMPNFTSANDGTLSAYFACVSTTGQLIVWGTNANGQLGTGAVADVLTPVVIAGITCRTGGGVTGNAPSVMGSTHDLRAYLRIIKSDGTTWASGNNNRGVFGNNTTVSSNVFVQETIGDTDVDQIPYCSTDIACWISTAGELRVCGNNSQGACGNGTLLPASVLTRFVPTFGGQGNVKSAIGVSTGNVANMFVLCNDGTVWAAGSDSNGQTGQGTVGQLNYMTIVKIEFPEPVEVFAMNVQPITGAGSLVVHFNCTNGTLWSCGNNSNGSMGIEYAYGDSMPSVQKVRLF